VRSYLHVRNVKFWGGANVWGLMSVSRPGHVVLDGDPFPPNRGTAPLPDFRPMSVRCSQTAERIKMSLGTEVASAQVTLC